jgi:D-serine deaminase-like pyridoxal phosphate-dependent protein
VAGYLTQLRDAVLRLGGLFEVPEIVVTAGGSSYFDSVAEVLTEWPSGVAVRTIVRSGAYLTHDDGLYRRTSPLSRPGRGHHPLVADGAASLLPALTVWAQVVSRPEAELAVLTLGRRDVSFDQDLPVPYGLTGSTVTKLNDQHAYLRLGPTDEVDVGDWLEFGISHPCTTFDKWPLIPVLDAENRVVELIRTFF